MAKGDYRLECLVRSPHFTADVLAFYERFPPLFLPHALAEHPPACPPKAFASLVNASGTAWIGAPRTLDDIHMLSGFAAEIALGRRLRPEDGRRYFKALGAESPKSFEAAFRALQARWPYIEPTAFRYPAHHELAPRPTLLVAGTSLPSAAVAVIPIYPDTTWAEIEELRRPFLQFRRLLTGPDRPRHRARADRFAPRLRVWDAYQKHRSLAAVAQALGIAPPTVRRLYLQAALDIVGQTPAGPTKVRRLHGFDLKAHEKTCQRCPRADRDEDLCPAARAYANQDHVAWRSGTRPSATPEDPDPLTSIR